MKAEKLMSAIGGISDRHIVEFSEIKPVTSQKNMWLKIASVAICLLLLIVVPIIYNYVNTPQESAFAVPYVKINDKVYVIDANHPDSSMTELSDAYVVIGKVERNPTSNQSQEIINGDAAGCKVGEEIFQSLDLPNEIYVYTKLFSANGEYRYIRFVCKD